MVTEAVVPLENVIGELNTKEIIAGIHGIITTVTFLHKVVISIFFLVQQVIDLRTTLSFLDWPKPAASPLLFYCLTPDNVTCQGKASGWEKG